MNGILVEVMDSRDKDSSEQWSFFGVYESLEKFHEFDWNTLVQYCRDNPIEAITIRKI